MIELWKKVYWSKSEAFLLPLTGLKNHTTFDITSYLFWEDYSIDNYQLIVKIEYGYRYNEFLEFLKQSLFDKKKGLIIEAHDFQGFTVLVFDMSEWAFDIEQFLKGKYSKFSKEAKELIESFHHYIEKGKLKIHVDIYGCLYPFEEQKVLGNLNALEYAAKVYGVSESELKKIGELCSIYDNSKEMLVLDSQNDSKISSE